MRDLRKIVKFDGANVRTIMAEEKKQYDIFISWSNDDWKVVDQWNYVDEHEKKEVSVGALIAASLRHYLEAILDSKMVYYSRDVKLGVWDKALFDALKTCKLSIFVATEHFLDSMWCNLEFGASKMVADKIIVFKVSGCNPFDRSHSLIADNHYQFVDFGLSGIKELLEKLQECFNLGSSFKIDKKIKIWQNAYANNLEEIIKGINTPYIRSYKLKEQLSKMEVENQRLTDIINKSPRFEIAKLSMRNATLQMENQDLNKLNSSLTTRINDLEATIKMLQDGHTIADNNSDSQSNLTNANITDKLSRFLTDNMVLVDGGSFWMDKRTGYRVNLSSYYIGKFQVTQRLWKKIMGINPSYFNDNGEKPVECVTWYDAVCFCNRLSMEMDLESVYELTQREYDTDDKDYQHIVKADVKIDIAKFGFRLPTEAEWEYAARGGNQNSNNDYEFSGSNNIDDVAVYCKNSRDLGTDNPNYGTHTVGSKNKNALGIYDMSGNVWEWCQDWKGDYPTEQIGSDPQGPASGAYRVLRGGSWFSVADSCRVSYRIDIAPDLRSFDNGFRLLLSSPKK